MDKTTVFFGGQFDHCIIFLFYFSCFVFTKQADGEINIFVSLGVQRSGSVEEERGGGAIQFIAIEGGDKCLLVIRHFGVFDDADVLLLQFFHDGSESFFKLFVEAVV